jgi:hypothetical protein
VSGVIRGGGGSSGASLNERRERPSGPGWQGWLLLCTAFPPVFLAGCTLLGVGLERQLPAQIALLAALLLTTLPILGLASPFRLRGKVVPLGLGAWAWSLALLLGAPLYFASEPGELARAGITWLLEPMGEDVAASVADAGAGVLAALLPEITALPMADSLPIEPEEDRTPRSVPIGAAAVIDESEVDPPSGPTGRVVLPYEGAGRSMRVPVTIGGPSADLELTMLFDTGATLTTLNAATLARLGVAVPSDAPVVTLQTANGQVEAPLVLIDAVWLGEERIDWATVAVCEACADGGVSGLLGLNVTGLFQVALDHEDREIDLTRRAQQGDRHEDVTHWVQLDSTARVWTDRRVEVDVTAQNRARAPMDGLTVEVACHDRSFAVALEPLEPGAARTAEVALPRGTDCREYRVMLREGRWHVD